MVLGQITVQDLPEQEDINRIIYKRMGFAHSLFIFYLYHKKLSYSSIQIIEHKKTVPDFKYC